MNITQRFVLFTLVFLNACDAVSPFVTQKAFDERLDRDRDGVKNDDDCEPDNQAVTTFSFWHDLDGDGRGAGEALKACIAPKGYVDNHDDCDDTNSNIYPFRDERCNDIDDNCDGVTDTDAVDRSTFYLDNDKDTFGDPAVSVTTCDKPSGYVTDHTDCNDNIASVAPDAIEVCNDVDDDCDGATDTDAVNPPKWYADGDGDGFGDAEISSGAGADRSIASCMQPFGNIPDHTDCNDANKYIHPGQFEICNGMDDDCDDTTDEDAVDAPTFYADTDEDKYGNPNVSVTVCVKPNGYVEDKTDCDDTDKSVHPNNVEICNSIDDNCDDEIDTDAIDQQTFFVDADSDGYGDASITTTACKKPDGYVTNNTDCDDTDKAVFPGQTEVCNGVDDNCNGSTDTDVAALPKWYVDADEDGFGNIKFLIADCDKPEGYVANKNDCNDLNPDVHPDAAEVCNSIDDDCDGSTDANALDAVWYFADEDEDGYGNAALSLHVCEEPEGFVTDDTDCDDTLDFIHPDTVEVCEDGYDNDCNGVTDTDAVEVVWYRDADGDGYGSSEKTQMACSPPPGHVGNALDCNDDSSSVKPGIAEVCNNGVDDNCDESINQCMFAPIYTPGSVDVTIQSGIKNGLAGTSIADVGDINNDTFHDLAIGSPGIKGGTAYIFFGPITSGIQNLSQADVIFALMAESGDAGWTVSGIGDINHDTYNDIAISADELNGGTIFIFFGPITSGTKNLSNADVIFTAEETGDHAGWSIAHIGDVNNDMIDDFAVGAMTALKAAGVVYIFFGPISPGTKSLSTANAKFVGESTDDIAAWTIASGDVNNDTIKDIIVGAPGFSTQTGAAYFLFGPITPGTKSLSTANAKFVGESAGSRAGSSIAYLGDINGDTISDVAIGAPNHQENPGTVSTVYVLFGPITLGTKSLSTAHAKFTAEADGQQAGWSLAGAGDVNGDNILDLAISAPKKEQKGSVYIVLGPISPGLKTFSDVNIKFMGQSGNGRAGHAVAFGDWSADGITDLSVGVPNSSGVGEDSAQAGNVYIKFGLGL